MTIDFDKSKPNSNPPSKKMIDYMTLLFYDTGFTYESRNAWLTNMYKRNIKHIDELSMHEGHEVINRLKEIREDQK